MDKATIGGLITGVSLLILSILLAPGATFSAFIDYPSAAVVIGGALAASSISFPLATLLNLPRVMKKLFAPGHVDLKAVIARMVQFSETARRDGILALENNLEEIDDSFMALGIQMAIDGADAELMEDVLRSEIEALATRHKTGKSLMDAMGRYAPAFGMIGTLMGLIIMLGNMEDPEAIGPGMAVALTTTLYGAVVANLFFLPFADKLAHYSRQELQAREVILRGILAIQDGDNPRVVEQKLKTWLSAAERDRDVPAKAA